jgi:hypothetical protein
MHSCPFWMLGKPERTRKHRDRNNRTISSDHDARTASRSPGKDDGPSVHYPIKTTNHASQTGAVDLQKAVSARKLMLLGAVFFSNVCLPHAFTVKFMAPHWHGATWRD